MALRGRLVGAETYARRSLTDVRRLVVHHSGVDIDSTAMQIAQYHVNVLGWPGIGYHFRVGQDGQIDYCGDLETIRYNVAGLNRSCLGICLPGNWSRRHPPAPQLAATRALVAWLRLQLPSADVVGHRDVALPSSPTACPGDSWPKWRGMIA